MTDVQKITNLTNLVEEIVEKYYDAYPETSTDIFTIAAIMMNVTEELEKFKNVTKDDYPTIISTIHNKYEKNETDNIFIQLLRDFKMIPETKNNCNKTCNCNKEKNTTNVFSSSSQEKISVEKQKENKPCQCNDKKTNVKNTETEKTIQILMPGIEKENVSITVEEKNLVVKLKNVVFEYPFVNPNIKYEFPIDDNFDIQNTKSSLKNGILTIVMPKKEKQKITITID